MSKRLLDEWNKAALDLNLQVTTPFGLQLASGQEVNAILLLEQFGATNGMLIVVDFGELEPYLDEINAAGYGFSVLSEPNEDDEYVKEEFVEMLEDWGWTGDIKLKPAWL